MKFSCEIRHPGQLLYHALRQNLSSISPSASITDKLFQKNCAIKLFIISLPSYLWTDITRLLPENQIIILKKYIVMGINANKKVKRRKVRVCGNKNSTNNWGVNAQGWTAVHKAVIAAE